MNAVNKYAASLLIAICLTMSCVPSLSRTTTSLPGTPSQQAQQPAPRESAAGSDLAQVAQLTIDLPALQKFYHADAVPGRKPLLILKNEFVAAEPPLSKFDEPVRFVTCDELKATGKPYLEFTVLGIKGDEAAAVFRYRAEEIKGRVSFAKQAGAWQAQKQALVEAKFADRGCAPESGRIVG